MAALGPMGTTIPRGQSANRDHCLGKTPRPPSWRAHATFGVTIPDLCSFSSDHRLGRCLCPQAGGPTPRGAAVP